jgi:hypothetical protein
MNEARYVYCIVEGSQKAHLGNIGIDGSEVYTIPFQDISAVVHNCPDEPYESKDNEVVKNWVIKHEKVIEKAWEKMGTVLPFGFDTIIKADGEKDPEEIVIYWLEEDYQSLREKLEKVKGKAEYAVQIFWDTKLISQLITEKDEELKRLSEGIKSMSKGVAYMYRQKIEKLFRGKLEKEAERYFKEFYGRIKEFIYEMRMEKLKTEEEPRQMIMNVSCLADKKNVKALGDELDKINNMEGFFVRFTGPWPPYSFV